MNVLTMEQADVGMLYLIGGRMRKMKLNKVFTLLESGPVVLVTTCDDNRENIMAISWTMVLDFKPLFAITTGEWNYSFHALRKNKECVIAIPTVDLLDKLIGIGTCSGVDTDKFAQFKLTSVPSKFVRPPLIKECLANIECKVIDFIPQYHICILEALTAYLDTDREEQRMLHSIGDGNFVVDGHKLNRKKMMASKVPYGI